MADFLIAATKMDGKAINDGLTRYLPAFAVIDANDTEARAQSLARDSYTLKNMLVKVITNTLTNTATIVSRINGGNGNQTVSIGAAATGTFEDTVNSDSLSSGNLFNSRIVAPAGGTSIILSAISYILSGSTCIVGSFGGSYAGGTTNYIPICGEGTLGSAEAIVKYIIRTNMTLSNMRVYVSSNPTYAASVRLRVNGINGNQVVSIGAGATGAFEDAANTDDISAGDYVDYYLTYQPDPWFYLDTLQIKTSVPNRPTGWAYYSSMNFGDGDTRYYPVEAGYYNLAGATEAETQIKIRSAISTTNLYVNVQSNTINGATIARSRINGGDGNLTVSIPSATSGTFEDIVNSDDLIADDLYNFQTVAAGSSGSLVLSPMGVEQRETGGGGGIADKSSHMSAKMIGAGLI